MQCLIEVEVNNYRYNWQIYEALPKDMGLDMPTAIALQGCSMCVLNIALQTICYSTL